MLREGVSPSEWRRPPPLPVLPDVDGAFGPEDGFDWAVDGAFPPVDGGFGEEDTPEEGFPPPTPPAAPTTEDTPLPAEETCWPCLIC